MSKSDKERKKYNKLFKFICNLGSSVFHCTYNIDREITNNLINKKGMIIFCNHLSSFDFIFGAKPFLDYDVSCVIADNMKFSNKTFHKALLNLNCIFKKQYYPDFQCIKNIKKTIDNGGTVVLCPEGKVSQEGITNKIPKTTGKLVKLLGCNVGIMLIKGTGLMRPKWAYNLRKSKVEVDTKVILDSIDIGKLSVDEINDLVQQNLSHNEYEYQQENGIKIKGFKYAEGIERMLYKCPKCGEEFCLYTHKNTITCKCCNNRIKYLKDGHIVPIGDSRCPESIPQWIDLEKRAIRKQISGGNIYQEYNVWMFKGNEKDSKYDYITAGKLAYDGEKITFTSFKSSVKIDIDLKFNVSYMSSRVRKLKTSKKVDDCYMHMIFNMKHMPSIANIPGDAIDLINDKGTFRFMFYDKKGSSKLAYSIEENYVQ